MATEAILCTKSLIWISSVETCRMEPLACLMPWLITSGSTLCRCSSRSSSRTCTAPRPSRSSCRACSECAPFECSPYQNGWHQRDEDLWHDLGGRGYGPQRVSDVHAPTSCTFAAAAWHSETKTSGMTLVVVAMVHSALAMSTRRLPAFLLALEHAATHAGLKVHDELLVHVLVGLGTCCHSRRSQGT